MLLPLPPQTAPTTIQLDLTKPGVAVSPTLYGQMTEEINYSYDGGLYGELVRNRAFLDDPKAPAHWSPVGSGASLALERPGPSAARPLFLGVSGGVANEGYWGIPVRPATSYRLNLWAKIDVKGTVAATLESTDGATIYARSEVRGLDGAWRKVGATLRTTRGVTPTKDARLVLRSAKGQELSLAQVSLFPPTYENRPNGNRPDLSEMLAAMRPKFLRFPGGNYLEGNFPEERFPWKETLGRIEDRPGHPSPWGYRSTDGMGLMEFLLWCEETGAKPLLGVYAGYALTGAVAKPGRELAPFVQEALEEIEYITGGPDTKWGAQRARNGHPKPFPLVAVEVGNEDNFDKTGSYEARYTQFHDAIRAKYPGLPIIASIGGPRAWGGQAFSARRPDLNDEHYYAEAWEMMAMATRYDDYDRKGPGVFVGEWASHDGPAPWEKGALAPTPNMRCTIGDAAFMTGLERNSDVVRMACYAPLLVNVNPGGRQWALNLIGYDALSAFGSPSYWMQRMFAENLGDRTVPLTITGTPTQTAPEGIKGPKTLPGLFASATRATADGTLYVKLVNPLPTTQEVAFDMPGTKIARTGTLTVLCGDPKAVNTIESPKNIAPVTTRLDGLGSTFRLTLAPTSVTVLRLLGAR